jgi:hypothetical protein
MSRIENFLLKFVDIFNLDRRVISREDGEKYLTRYYIFRKPLKWMPSIYIHCFHNGDPDLELHDHPWSKSASFILDGSYLEEKRYKTVDHSIPLCPSEREQSLLGPRYNVNIRKFSPGNVNYIRGTDFHRVQLLTPKVWTLFISGPKIKDWGFWDRHTGKYTNQEEFLNK